METKHAKYLNVSEFMKRTIWAAKQWEIWRRFTNSGEESESGSKSHGRLQERMDGMIVAGWKKKQFDWIKFNLIKSTCLCLNWKLSGIEIIMYVHISTEGKETKVCTFSCWKLFVIKIWFSLNSSNPCIKMNLLLHHKVTKVLQVHILCEKLTLTLFHGKFS